MSDESRGLYNKYHVERVDGSGSPGGKHHNCKYFILDLHHDKHAVAALRAYILSCRKEFPQLADDLGDKVVEMEARFMPARKSLPAKTGEPWTEDEDRRLLAGFDRGLGIAELAKAHKRTMTGVRARLTKYGRISP